MRKKVLAALLFGTMGMTLLAGCGQSKETIDSEVKEEKSSEVSSASNVSEEVDYNKKFTLKIVGAGEKEDSIDVAMRIYKEKYPNAEFEIITSPWGDGGSETREKELVLLNSGDIPDIGKMVWGKEFAREGLLMDVTNEIKQMEIYPELSEGQLERMTYDGKNFGMTFGNNCIYMYYNKDILKDAGWEKPPTTIDEVTKLAKDIKEKDLKTIDGKSIYLTNFEGGNWATDYWLWANGGEQMNEDYSKTLIDSPESIKAFTYMQDLVKNGSVPKIDGTGSQLWLNGQQALLFSGEWDLEGTKDAGISYGIATTPVGSTGENTVSIGGVEWGIFEGSEHKQESLDFINVMVSKEFAYEAGRGVTNLSFYDDPERQKVWEEEGVLDAKLVQRDQLKHTKYNFLEAPYKFPDASKIYSDALEKVLVRMDPVEETMKAAAAEINAGLAEAN
ncbi:ABC transporter substrate-binding protein [Robinsoniella sp. KNHs210]|uniref:ABC transporter substrate-binding protein n=1 Tax=Robinsoniella sp. KNHs210 TaxID=1469950 RepID=UPI00048023C4|nr:sugar ABC transporter substrate-binding protein [Robinsoniella sp. KNHs210]